MYPRVPSTSFTAQNPTSVRVQLAPHGAKKLIKHIPILRRYVYAWSPEATTKKLRYFRVAPQIYKLSPPLPYLNRIENTCTFHVEEIMDFD